MAATVPEMAQDKRSPAALVFFLHLLFLFGAIALRNLILIVVVPTKPQRQGGPREKQRGRCRPERTLLPSARTRRAGGKLRSSVSTIFCVCVGVGRGSRTDLRAACGLGGDRGR